MLKNLKYLRDKRGLSQSQLAKAVGISQQTINKYENQATEPDLKTLMTLAAYFDTSVDFLIGNTDIERKYEAVYECDLNATELKVMEAYRETDPVYQDAILYLIRKQSAQKK